MKFSKDEDIDCAIEIGEEETQKFHDALDCCKSYQEVIEASNIKKAISGPIYFEFFQENFDPWVKDIGEGL